MLFFTAAEYSVLFILFHLRSLLIDITIINNNSEYLTRFLVQ